METLYKIFDWLSVGTFIAALADLLPIATMIITFVWMCIRVYETDTVKAFLEKRKQKVDKLK